MKWKKYEINLGNTKANAKHILEYNLDELKAEDILKVRPSCGSCTTIISYNDTVLVAEYKVKEIPKHLQINPGFQNIRKTIVITYKTGEEEVLSFTGKIIK